MTPRPATRYRLAMLRRTLLGLSAAFAVTAAQAQTPPPAPATAPTPPAVKPNPRVKLETAEGVIVIELYADKAPITVANYLKYVDRGFYNGASFYRASRPKDYKANDYGLVQGGQKDPAKMLPPIAHESTIKTGLTHGKDGVISMGRFAPGSARADWSIMLGDMSYLDADPKDPRANPGFAAFGQVVEGIEVIRKIIVMPTDPNKGEGAMKGEILVKPIRITKVSRAPLTPPPVVAPAAPAAPVAQLSKVP